MRDRRHELFQQPEVQERLNSFLNLIKSYSGSGTYFVRKISAHAMLPLLKFSEFIPEVVRTLKNLIDSENSVRQNQAHGELVRVQIFIQAYFKYRSVAQPDVDNFDQEERQLLEALLAFQKNLVNWGKYSKVTWGLFLKTLRFCLSKVDQKVAQPNLADLHAQYSAESDQLIAAASSESANLNLEAQAYLKAVIKTQLELLVQLKKTDEVQSLLEAVAGIPQDDLVYMFLKAFHRKLSQLKHSEGVDPIIFQRVSIFLLHGVIRKDLKESSGSGEGFEGLDPANGLPSQTDDMLRQMLMQTKQEDDESASVA